MEREKLEKLFDLFQKEYRYKSVRYKLNIREFCSRVLKWLDGREFSLQTMNEYSDFLREKGFRKKWGDNALHKEVQLIQAITEFLFDEGYIEKNWGKKLQKPKTVIPIHFTTITKEQVFEYLKEVCKTTTGMSKINIFSKVEHYWALIFALATGLRNSELRGIKIRHLSIENSEVIIPRNKGGNPKVVEISKWPWLFDELKKRVDEREEEDVLFTVTRTKLQITMARVKELAKIPKEYKFTVHSLRHLFATDIYNNCEDLGKVQLIMDHSDMDTTKRYVHQSAGAKRKVVDRYESVSQSYRTDLDRYDSIEENINKGGQVLEKKLNEDGTMTYTIKLQPAKKY